MQIKKHLSGGTLRAAMVDAIKAAMASFTEQDQQKERAAMELGLAPRTLRVWLGPEDKGGWPELQGIVGSVEKLVSTKPKTKKKRKAKKSSQ